MKTLRIRLAVAISRDGDWYAVGWRPLTDDYESDVMNEAEDAVGLGRVDARYWIEADIPIPETQTITATQVLPVSAG